MITTLPTRWTLHENNWSGMNLTVLADVPEAAPQATRQVAGTSDAPMAINPNSRTKGMG